MTTISIPRSKLVYRAPAEEVVVSPDVSNRMLEAKLPSATLMEVSRTGLSPAQIHRKNNELYLVDMVEMLIQKIIGRVELREDK